MLTRRIGAGIIIRSAKGRGSCGREASQSLRARKEVERHPANSREKAPTICAGEVPGFAGANLNIGLRVRMSTGGSHKFVDFNRGSPSFKKRSTI